MRSPRASTRAIETRLDHPLLPFADSGQTPTTRPRTPASHPPPAGHRLPEITVDKPPNEKPATQANLSLAPLGGTGSEFRCLRYDAAIARVSSGVHALAMNESSSPMTRRVNPLTAGFDSGHTA